MLAPARRLTTRLPGLYPKSWLVKAESTPRSRVEHGANSGLQQPKDDVLAVIAEAGAEDVDAAGMARFLLDADTYPDRTVPLQLQGGQRTFGDLGAVAIGAVLGDTPLLDVAILRTGQFPPVRR